MGTYRMYTTSEGHSTWEPINLDEQPEWMSGLDTTRIRFGKRPPNVLEDWHPAPQRQFVVILSGQLQITFTDGSKKTFGPGDARLVEDTTGTGHQTMALGNEPCITATIGLVKQD